MKKRKTGFIVSLAILLMVVGSVGVGLNFTKVKRDMQYYEGTYETENMDTLSLDIGNRGDTTIHYTNSDQIEVTLSGTDLKKTPITTTYSNDKIQMSVPSTNENFFDQFDFDIHLFFMEFNFNSNVKLDIYLPKSIQNIEIKGTSANLFVDEDLSVKHMKVVTNSGNVNISELNTDKLSIQTTSGNIELNDITANKTTLEAHSGNLYLNELLGTIKGSTTSGNIQWINDTLDQDVDLQATSGNIEINLEDSPKDATIKTKTSSGYVHLGDEDSGKQKTFGKGTNRIELKTSSGNISVSKQSFFDEDDDDYDD